uniref:Uncharacterized protein n=1 Tax=Theileria annulata TaxID=5874 RepID=A0A3B0MJH6_THEAN
MNYILFFLLLRCIISSGQSDIEEDLRRSISRTNYEIRRYMTDCFHDCDEHISELNDYIQKIEAARFKDNSEKHSTKFQNDYTDFQSEFKQLKTTYESYRMDESDIDFKNKFTKALSSFDKIFTRASSTFSNSFRKVNNSLTKLDETKMTYMGAEVYKKSEKSVLVTKHRIRGIDEMVKLVELRGDECGPLSNREPFHKEAIDKLKVNLEESINLLYDFPLTVVNEEQLRKVDEIEERIKDLFHNGIKIMEEFDENLRKMYESKGVKYNKDYKKLIKFFEKIPYRLSSFVTPNTLGSMIIVSFLLMNVFYLN